MDLPTLLLAAEDGGGTRIDLGVIGVVLLVIVVAVVYLRRRNGR